MSRPKIVIIRSNPITHDPRVLKIAKSLADKYEVLVLGWDRERTFETVETRSGFSIRRLKLRSPYGTYFLGFYYPIYWAWVLRVLHDYEPSVIHACDLDSLIPAYLYRRLFPSKLVFDSFDKFAMAFIPPRHRILYRWVDSFENILTSKVDAFITVSNERLRIFPSIPALSAIVMNCPDGYPSLGSDRQNALDGADLVLVYAGSIARDRGLVEVSRALSSFENVRFLVAGRVIDRDTFDELNQNPKVQYLGMLDGDAAIALQQRADLIPIIYDQSIPINRVASPNKLFEAMMIKVPVISNVCTDLVNEIGCGIVVSGTVGSIANAISFALGNRNALRAMGDKGFSAWQISYNWTSMKQRLFDVYDKVSKFD